MPAQRVCILHSLFAEQKPIATTGTRAAFAYLDADGNGYIARREYTANMKDASRTKDNARSS